MGPLIVDARDDDAGVDQIAAGPQVKIAVGLIHKARNHVQTVYLLTSLSLNFCQCVQV